MKFERSSLRELIERRDDEDNDSIVDRLGNMPAESSKGDSPAKNKTKTSSTEASESEDNVPPLLDRESPKPKNDNDSIGQRIGNLPALPDTEAEDAEGRVDIGEPVDIPSEEETPSPKRAAKPSAPVSRPTPSRWPTSFSREQQIEAENKLKQRERERAAGVAFAERVRQGFADAGGYQDPRGISITPEDQDRWNKMAKARGTDINTIRAQEINQAIREKNREKNEAAKRAQYEESIENKKKLGADIDKIHRAFSANKISEPTFRGGGIEWSPEVLRYKKALDRLKDEGYDIDTFNPENLEHQARLRKAVYAVDTQEYDNLSRSIQQYNKDVIALKNKIGEEQFAKLGLSATSYDPTKFGERILESGENIGMRLKAGLRTDENARSFFENQKRLRASLQDIRSEEQHQRKLTDLRRRQEEKAAKTGQPSQTPAPTQKTTASRTTTAPTSAPTSVQPTASTSTRVTQPTAVALRPGGTAVQPKISSTVPTQMAAAMGTYSAGSPGSNSQQMAALMSKGGMPASEQSTKEQPQFSSKTPQETELAATTTTGDTKRTGLRSERSGALRATGTKQGKGFTSQIVRLTEAIRFKQNEIKLFNEARMITPAQASVSHYAGPKLMLADIDMSGGVMPGEETIKKIIKKTPSALANTAKTAFDIGLLPPEQRAVTRLQDIGYTKRMAKSAAKYYATSPIAGSAAVAALLTKGGSSKAIQQLLGRAQLLSNINKEGILGKLIGKIPGVSSERGKKVMSSLGKGYNSLMDIAGGKELLQARAGIELASVFAGDDRIRALDPGEVADEIRAQQAADREELRREKEAQAAERAAAGAPRIP